MNRIDDIINIYLNIKNNITNYPIIITDERISVKHLENDRMYYEYNDDTYLRIIMALHNNKLSFFTSLKTSSDEYNYFVRYLEDGLMIDNNAYSYFKSEITKYEKCNCDIFLLLYNI